MNSKRYTYLSYNQIAMKIDSMVNTIREQAYDALVVIVRGGSFPGTHLSIRTGLPIYYLAYNRKSNPATVTWIGEAAPIGKILLVEDIAGSGRTLISCRDFLIQWGFEVNTFVIFKDRMSASVPDFHCFSTSEPGQTFLLPWEKTKLNPEYEILDKSERFVDHELEFTVWNMNCFVEKNPVNRFVKRSITPFYLLEEKDVIFSHEPANELIFSNWLKENKVSHPFHSMNSNVVKDTALGYAIEKGNELMDIGCTRYVENDVESIVLLNSCFPHLEVLWWNNGNPIALTTSHTG